MGDRAVTDYHHEVVRRIEAFSEDECAGMAATVGELERWWTRRHPDLPSFTLGGAAYLDVPSGGVHQYLMNKSRGNRILDRHFREVITKVVERLGTLLDGPAYLTERFAFPGFHIYGYHPELSRLAPSVHWDMQDLDLPDWEDEARPPRCSFTMPIRAPREGAGVKIWPKLQQSEISYVEACHRAKDEEPEHHVYNLGEIFVHSGDLLHQIATTRLPEEGEARVTLQGHGRKTGDGWEIYW